jgi:hypothetical protein
LVRGHRDHREKTAKIRRENALAAKIGKVFVIGDQSKPGKIFDAVHQGYNTIRLLDDLMETI